MMMIIEFMTINYISISEYLREYLYELIKEY
jgi:hypothetical protein